MPRSDVEFKTTDGVTLRGWFYQPAALAADTKLPCLVMSPGFSCLKEMDLSIFADRFMVDLPISCLVYDNRGFGDSDTGPGQPRHEILPHQQIADISDAITYAQSRPDVDASKIGIWGSSYSGGHVLRVGAIDPRVKAVLSQVPSLDGFTSFSRMIRPDFAEGVYAAFQQDRIDRAAGKAPAMMPVVDQDPFKPAALPTPDSHKYFSAWGEKSNWKNDVTLRSVEAIRSNTPTDDIHRISPTPLLMTVAENDLLAPTDLALEAYSRAREPKELSMLPGGHFGGYSGANFERNVTRQVDFLRRHLITKYA